MNPRISAIKDELIKTVKSFSTIAISLGGGIIPFFLYLLDWIPSGNLIFIAPFSIILVFLSILIWNISRYAEAGYWHDRKYKLIHNKWIYSPNPDLKTLCAECHGIRHIVCLEGSIAYTTVGVGPRENLVPFDPNDKYLIYLDPQSRRENGSMRIRLPHRKEGASFSFRIDFTPPLTQGEEAFIKYKFTLPKFKISNLEHLREKCAQANLDARDYEYNSYSLAHPVDKFIYELNFSPESCVKARKIEVKRGTSIWYSEQLIIEKNKSFTCDEDPNGWLQVMKLEREKPPINIRYILSWNPPRTYELEKAFQTP